MPDQTGRRVLVTGANSGIGLETARMMAAAGAEVILACRNDDVLGALGEKTTHEAIAAIRAEHPYAAVEALEVDLASQASTRLLAQAFHARFDRLDVLINNAGVMWSPESRTTDGFETQLGINHLGHFALTGLLLPALARSPGSRIVAVSSLAHRTASRDLGDRFYRRRAYDPQKAYSQSKVANLLFSRELGRRLEAAGMQTLSIAAHPGLSSTGLFASAFPRSRFLGALFGKGASIVGQSAREGALPSVYAATKAGLRNGDYLGPQGLFELRGHPGEASSSKLSRDPVPARQLWEISEQLTGVTYAFVADEGRAPRQARASVQAAGDASA